MKDVVVDASLAIKWVLREEDSQVAKALLQTWKSEGVSVLAPGLFTSEVTNILHRQVVSAKLSYNDAQQLLKKLLSIGIIFDFSDYEEISIRAMDFAHQFNLAAAYDAHYLALAEYYGCLFWTADARLFHAVSGKLPWIREMSSSTDRA